MVKHATRTDYPGLQAIHRLLAVVLEADCAWYLDWKLYAGLAVYTGIWIKWTKYGYKGEYTPKAFLTLSFDILLLAILQHTGRAGFLIVIPLILANGLYGMIAFWSKQDPFGRGNFEADSLYQCLRSPLVQIIFLFVGQTGLIVFYLSSLINNFDMDKFNYVYWLIAYFAMQMSAYFNRGNDGYLGKIWPTSEWYAICAANHKVQYSTSGRNGKRSAPFTMWTSEVALRGCMGFFINMNVREGIAFTIPILLAQFEDPLSFVVYCIGVNFIATLDDCTPRVYHIELRESLPSDLEDSKEASKAPDSKEASQASYGATNSTPVSPYLHSHGIK